MSLFDWLRTVFRPRALQPIDKLWLTEEAKFQGIASEIAGVSATTAIVLVAHFRDTLAQLETRLEEFDVGVEVISRTKNFLDLLQPRSGELQVPALATTSEQLPRFDNELLGFLRFGIQSVALVVVEKHPLPTYERRVVEFTNLLPCRSRLSFHTSLEDPMIRILTADWIADQLRDMGVKENQALESYIVSREIRLLQQRLEASCPRPEPAASAQEWLRVNAQIS
ncbi:MAG: hypothetical protein ACFCD0_01305 [Gemmataceae bacterium]